MTKMSPEKDVSGDRALDAVRGFARAVRILDRSSRELSMPHYRVLASVAAGEERASRVAERLELGRPAISSAVEALCGNGFLQRLEVEGDQRAVDLRVTPEGFAVLERVEHEMTNTLRTLCARVEEGEQLLTSLAMLDRAVDAMFAEKRAARVRTQQ
ncbi:MAG TPA: MarR family winged helix-turn-helix transcriptional regulator [Acidimicrobiales bacterium]|jgi:DNA-binding MarR family transcriptional regulator|nr:MarR family winged helix-turn-helix transcriptional regulator [Acidimicrobiales bacterium]